ncbi:hypothetical protein Y032_0663g1302 [Ancylostoma ceylanicum]|uniref:Uncharacterized protein n=1 Tax=Ancylostoma ceylanicum TaxID=53326 RepID=A0A016WHJ1_9BILA|nr:hypothetical protein Y032_0663g1302 [Ancylostoma ceylanicum]
MHTLWAVLFLLVLVTDMLCDSSPNIESVSVKGQLIVADESEEVDSTQTEQPDDDVFDKLESFRIAREYLRRKIAEERNREKTIATNIDDFAARTV